MHPVEERIRQILPHPLTSIGEEALTAALELPYVQQQIPEQIYLAVAQSVLKYGLFIALNKGNSSFEAHLQKLRKAEGDPAQVLASSFFSEIEACYVLSRFGADVSYVKTGTKRTPDLEVALHDSTKLDAEVARGETRQLHQAVYQGLSQLAGALAPSDTGFHLLCRFADASCTTDLEAALDAVAKLRVGESAEVEGRWAVTAVPLEDRDAVVTEQAHLIPKWWPNDAPCAFLAQTLLGLAGNPYVSLKSLFPQASYLNPILRKAESGQYDSTRPYLICVDCVDLPRAHERIQPELPGYFAIWPHVSGVLLFEARFYIGTLEKHWIYSLHKNPSASHPLPESIFTMSDGQRQSFVLQLIAVPVEIVG